MHPYITLHTHTCSKYTRMQKTQERLDVRGSNNTNLHSPVLRYRLRPPRMQTLLPHLFPQRRSFLSPEMDVCNPLDRLRRTRRASLPREFPRTVCVAAERMRRAGRVKRYITLDVGHTKQLDSLRTFLAPVAHIASSCG